MTRPTLEQASRNTSYDVFGPASSKFNGQAVSLSELLGLMDQDLAEQRNAPAKATPKVVTSRIRVLLNRPLTWSEKESLETNWEDDHSRRFADSPEAVNGGLSVRVAENHEHVWAEAPFGSRILFELISAAVADNFVNVHPIAVRTFREYNGE